MCELNVSIEKRENEEEEEKIRQKEKSPPRTTHV